MPDPFTLGHTPFGPTRAVVLGINIKRTWWERITYRLRRHPEFAAWYKDQPMEKIRESASGATFILKGEDIG